MCFRWRFQTRAVPAALRLIAAIWLSTLTGCGLFDRHDPDRFSDAIYQKSIGPDSFPMPTTTEAVPPYGWKDEPLTYRVNHTTNLQPDIRQNDPIDLWADTHLETGDIVFRRGITWMLHGSFDSSGFFADLGRSPFSHAGIAIRDGEHVYIHDITRALGPARSTLSAFLLEDDLVFAIKRPRAEYRHAMPRVEEYIRFVHQRKIPFDGDFQLANDSLYCVEMLEAAYRYAGIPLSEPVRINELPGYPDFPVLTKIIGVVTDMEPEQVVFSPGNDTQGLWASPVLEYVIGDLSGTGFRRRLTQPRVGEPSSDAAPLTFPTPTLQ